MACLSLLGGVMLVQAQQKEIFRDVRQPLEKRVQDFITRLTLEEKVSQMIYNSPAIPRLQVPAYNWWNEALHGVGRSGVATVFPQAIALAATFDDSLAKAEAAVIATEARAMYNMSIAAGHRMKYGGLSFWTPNINIFRDPRWGRGQETYGEDPYLTAKMGVAFVKGLQGDDPKYLKVAACAKHYAVHSGPEKLRHEFNAVANAHDLWDTYLPAFKALVDARVEAVMCAYNRTNNEPCCGNTYLLQDVLRKQWNFKGHVVTDCWALADFYQGHKVVADAKEASALAVNKGVSLNCGDEFKAGLEMAVRDGLVSEKQLDSALAVLLRTKFRLGLLDPKGSTPFDALNAADINNAAHRKLAGTVAEKSIVLLKNNGVLPLSDGLPKYFVTGPNAATIDVLLGNYYGVSDHMVTILEGIAAQVKPGSQVQYRPGVLLDRPNINPIDWASEEAKNTDVTIYVMGISGLLEGEEGESIASPSFGDRLDYNIPQNQIDFLRKLKKDNNKPVVAVVTGGSPMNLSEVHEVADAVLLVWYPGEEGGNAVANILFGKVAPSGKLPVTFPKSLDDLPAYEDYTMKGRTYRYMEKEPFYPFGYGLSYTTFSYSGLTLSKKQVGKNEPVTATVTVTNTGRVAGEEVVQLYLSHRNSLKEAPLQSLKGFKRVNLQPGVSKKISFVITPDMLSLVNEEGKQVTPAGEIEMVVSGASPGARSHLLGAPAPVKAVVTIQ